MCETVAGDVPGLPWFCRVCPVWLYCARCRDSQAKSIDTVEVPTHQGPRPRRGARSGLLSMTAG